MSRKKNCSTSRPLIEGQQVTNASGSCYTTPKNGFPRGQCTWYAKGRFCEVTGRVLDFPGGSDAKYFGTNVKIKNKNVIVNNTPSAKSIGVRKTGGNGHGHVIFIEYIDGNGNAYISDANAGFGTGKIRKLTKSGLKEYTEFIH
ncbi:MAG: CHAP domain-containing protein [Oxalobacter formigenes]|nr:CHAP domain-containing protein [Oxalobacter formigenes]